MTSEQFDALAVLMGQPDSKSAAAARLVLVEGLSSAEAARRVGITTQGANQAVQRCRRVIELAKVVGEGGGAALLAVHAASIIRRTSTTAAAAACNGTTPFPQHLRRAARWWKSNPLATPSAIP